MKAALLICALAASASAEPIKVGPGVYRPIFPAQPSEREVSVHAFLLDETPVTNAQFDAFVKAHPEWQRDRVKKLFADEHYLDGFDKSARQRAGRARRQLVRSTCVLRGAQRPPPDRARIGARRRRE